MRVVVLWLVPEKPPYMVLDELLLIPKPWPKGVADCIPMGGPEGARDDADGAPKPKAMVSAILRWFWKKGWLSPNRLLPIGWPGLIIRKGSMPPPLPPMLPPVDPNSLLNIMLNRSKGSKPSTPNGLPGRRPA